MFDFGINGQLGSTPTRLEPRGLVDHA